MKSPALLSGLVLVVFSCFCRAAPTLDSIFPAGGQQGTTFELIAGGKLESWPLEASMDCPGVTFTALEEKGRFSVTIETNTPSGPHLLRVHGSDGASAPRIFVVGRVLEIGEEEPNNGGDEARQIGELPVTINGQLNKGGDIDSFRLSLEAGQTFIAAVDSYSIGSPVDAHLHLYGPDGVRAAFAHDSHNLDPRLVFEVVRPGDYTIQVAGFAHPPQANVRFHGGSEVVYRLQLTTGPWAEYAYPSGACIHTDTRIEVFGWNFAGGKDSVALDVEATDAETEWIELISDSFQNGLSVPVDDLPGEMETEPNDSEELPQAVGFPLVMNGRIDPEGDVDRFRFEGVQGTAYEFILRGLGLGSTLDAVLRIEDDAGKQLERADDSGKDRDPKLNWKAPKDGTYHLIVEDLYGRGAPGLVYRLRMGVAIPGFEASISPEQVVLEFGKSGDLKVNVTRSNGHRAPLRVEVDDLPEGVRFEADEVPEKGGDVKLTLHAAEEIPPASCSIRVRVTEKDDELRSCRATFSLRPEDDRGRLLINETDQVWLTVK